MDLVTQVKTKANTQVLVKGTIYKINEVGIIRDVSEKDAAVLLENINWRVVGQVGQGKVPKKQYSAPAITGVKLVDSGGNVIPGQVSDEKEEGALEPPILGEGEEEALSDPPIPGKGEDWADPDPLFSMDWLKACANAYNIAYRADIGPATLVKKIKKEMYG